VDRAAMKRISLGGIAADLQEDDLPLGTFLFWASRTQAVAVGCVVRLHNLLRTACLM